MPGAIEALKEIERLPGVTVRICTSAFTKNPMCEGEKREWVDHHLGADWLGERFVCERYKHKVPGTFLIDDRPG